MTIAAILWLDDDETGVGLLPWSQDPLPKNACSEVVDKSTERLLGAPMKWTVSCASRPLEDF
jgi:hypothetical protein